MESNSEESDARRAGDEADVEIEECPDEEEADTDLETDRLLGQQRTDDQGFYDDKVGAYARCCTTLAIRSYRYCYQSSLREIIVTNESPISLF